MRYFLEFTKPLNNVSCLLCNHNYSLKNNDQSNDP